MQNLQDNLHNANSFLSKEELKKLLTKKKDKIQTVLRKYGCTKAITLSADERQLFLFC